jgi:hypothetical protein
VGYAGNGHHCTQDRDIDGWPDYDLGCSDPRCRADNCVDIPNSGQVGLMGDLSFTTNSTELNRRKTLTMMDSVMRATLTLMTMEFPILP